MSLSFTLPNASNYSGGYQHSLNKGIKSNEGYSTNYIVLPPLSPPTRSTVPNSTGEEILPKRLPSIRLVLPEFYATNQLQLPTFATVLPNLNFDPNSNRNFTHSYVALSEQQNYKPRPRRKFEEVERLYQCTHPNCHKSYGALNHLNAHIVSKNHGLKRQPQEFLVMRRALKLRQKIQK